MTKRFSEKAGCKVLSNGNILECPIKRDDVSIEEKVDA
jgi:hypothetical protein